MTHTRYGIFDGDITTAGGDSKVISPPMAVPFSYNGRHGTFEGDKVWCCACKSYGYAKCIPPFRQDTSSDRRQRVLSDDLCICKCKMPPRFIASIKTFRIQFDATEVPSKAGAGLWSQLNSNSGEMDFHDEQYMLMDEAGNIMSEMAYTIKVKSTGAMVHGETDKDGMTQRIAMGSGGPADIKIFWGNQ